MEKELTIDILSSVQKPARYIGGEMGSVVKDFDKASCKVAFCFHRHFSKLP